MKFRDINKDDRAYMGMSLLILFVAIVIMAAIASSAIISTTEKVKSNAESTGHKTSDRGFRMLRILSITGDRNVHGNDNATPMESIQVLKIVVALQGGSSPIDLREASIQIESPELNTILTFDDINSPCNASFSTSETFTAQPLIDKGVRFSGSNLSVGRGDQILIWIDLGEAGVRLLPSKEIGIRVLVVNGQETFETLKAPLLFSDRYITLK